MSYESYKNKYINGKQSGVTNVGISGVSDSPDYLLEIDESNHLIQITAKADNTSGTCTLTQDESGNQYLIHCTTPSELIDNDILVTISSDPYEGLIANLEIAARHNVASDINFSMVIKYGVSSGDTLTKEITLKSGYGYIKERVPIQKEATPLILSGDYWPKEDDKYKYIVSFM